MQEVYESIAVFNENVLFLLVGKSQFPHSFPLSLFFFCLAWFLALHVINQLNPSPIVALMVYRNNYMLLSIEFLESYKFYSRYMHRWELDAALDVLTMCSCHLPQNDPIREEVLLFDLISCLYSITAKSLSRLPEA